MTNIEAYSIFLSIQNRVNHSHIEIDLCSDICYFNKRVNWFAIILLFKGIDSILPFQQFILFIISFHLQRLILYNTFNDIWLKNKRIDRSI